MTQTEQAQPTKQKNNEWYTPLSYIEAASQVMDGIELDPASCEMANQTVKAERYYTREENGLNQDWICKSMWLNPPFGKDYAIQNDGRGRIGKWVTKLLQSHKDGSIQQAILLAPTSIEATWFQWLWDYPICFANHEVKFYSPLGKRKFHMFGTVFVYFGPNEAKFVEVFSQFGHIAKAIDTPPAKPMMRELWEVSA